MKLSREDWLILLVGGPLFGVHAHWKFAKSPGLVVSIAVGFAVMAMIAGSLDRLIEGRKRRSDHGDDSGG